jgi:hypothetical protein
MPINQPVQISINKRARQQVLPSTLDEGEVGPGEQAE